MLCIFHALCEQILKGSPVDAEVPELLLKPNLELEAELPLYIMA